MINPWAKNELKYTSRSEKAEVWLEQWMQVEDRVRTDIIFAAVVI
jgi:hypothetical protein